MATPILDDPHVVSLAVPEDEVAFRASLSDTDVDSCLFRMPTEAVGSLGRVQLANIRRESAAVRGQPGLAGALQACSI